jgi:hypothetical protein
VNRYLVNRLVALWWYSAVLTINMFLDWDSTDSRSQKYERFYQRPYWALADPVR